MKRCRLCLMTSTRPDIRFRDDGVCSACDVYEKRPLIGWPEQEAAFRALMTKHKTHPAYDCLVAASGGKDSHYITIKALELGYRPLVVTATTDFLTLIGRRNIENLKGLGVDYIEFTANPVSRRKLNRIAFEEVGDMEWPEHALIFSTPVRIAKEMGIGIVLYGENPQNEIAGGRDGSQDAIRLDKRWREEYGGLLGLRPSDLVGREGITSADMWPYEWPAGADDVHALFLGQFFPWDGWKNAVIAQAHGFETYGKPVEGNTWESENLDNAIIGIHYYLLYLKFGFGRATTTASFDIRHGRITREEAIPLVRKADGRYPESYLGVSLDYVLNEIGLSRNECDTVFDQFANRQLLQQVGPGRWQLKPEFAL